ncbi:MAG TPA: hypothetical protein VGB97_00650 [Candidatus Paceibacterota bacterium]
MSDVSDKELDTVLGRRHTSGPRKGQLKYPGLNRTLLLTLAQETIVKKETLRLSVKDAKDAVLRIRFRARTREEEAEKHLYGSAICSLLGRRGGFAAHARSLIPRTRTTRRIPKVTLPAANEKGQFLFTFA